LAGLHVVVGRDDAGVDTFGPFRAGPGLDQALAPGDQRVVDLIEPPDRDAALRCVCEGLVVRVLQRRPQWCDNAILVLG
jgi:hypothetical protein